MTAVTDGTCSAGLVAVTVTPGRIAPVLSVTWPMMPAGFAAPWPAVAIVAPGEQIDENRQDDERGGSSPKRGGSTTTFALLLVLVPN